MLTNSMILFLGGVAPYTTQFCSRAFKTKCFATKTGWPHYKEEMPEFVQEIHSISELPYVQDCGGSLRCLVSEHTFKVPLLNNDSSNSNSNSNNQLIDVHATIVDKLPPDTSSSQIFKFFSSSKNLAASYSELMSKKNSRSLLYLQGGPGFPSPRPGSSLSISHTGSGSWASDAIVNKDIDRLVLLDQRGTGRSSPVSYQTLEMQFTDATAAASYLTNFRADAIVADSEQIKKKLLGPAKNWDVVLGQSFGGFCLATLLLTLPKNEHPKRALFTGGIPPACASIDATYEKLWQRVRKCNDWYYSKYPGDINNVKAIVTHLNENKVELPSGGKLTARRFLSVGISLGGGDGAHEALHELVLSAFLPNSRTISTNFLRKLESLQPFDSNPIYFLLHESIYMEKGKGASNFAAMRTMPSDFKIDTSKERVNFFGETVFKHMSEDFVELNSNFMVDVATLLSEKSDWGDLYSGGETSSFPNAAAAVYIDDMYVDYNLTEQTIEHKLQQCNKYITNELQHSGLRMRGSFLFDKLYNLCQVEK